MALNPSDTSSVNWNHTKPDKEDYSLELWGTVVSIQETQARHFNPNGGPGAPRFWDNGDPVFNIRMGFADPNGQLKSITFAEAGKAQREGRKPSLHMQLFGLTKGNMMELIGKTLHLWTWPAHPKTGQVWGQGNPRLYGVEVVDNVHYELSAPLSDEYKVPKLLANDGASGGQPIPPAPQQMQPVQVPVMTMPAPQPVQAPMPAPQSQPAPQPQPAQQVPVQGMDPAIAQAMASVPQPPAPMQVPYTDEDIIPF